MSSLETEREKALSVCNNLIEVGSKYKKKVLKARSTEEILGIMVSLLREADKLDN